MHLREAPAAAEVPGETNAAKNPPREETNYGGGGASSTKIRNMYLNIAYIYIYKYIYVYICRLFSTIFPVIRNIIFLLRSCRLLQNEEAGPRCADFTSKEKEHKDQMRHRLQSIHHHCW